MAELARIPLSSLADGTATRVDTPVGAVCVVRLGADLYGIADRCSHANVSLSEGDVDPYDRTVECWKHGSAFSLADGTPQSLPAITAVEVFGVTLDGDDVVVSR